VEQPRGAQEGGDKVLRYGLEKLREDRREVERILRQGRTRIGSVLMGPTGDHQHPHRRWVHWQQWATP